jgi:hypothetical protein
MRPGRAQLAAAFGSPSALAMLRDSVERADGEAEVPEEADAGTPPSTTDESTRMSEPSRVHAAGRGIPLVGQTPVICRRIESATVGWRGRISNS